MTKVSLTKVCFSVLILYKCSHFHFIKVRVGFLHPSSGEGCKSTKCLAQHKGAAHKVIINNNYYYFMNARWKVRWWIAIEAHSAELAITSLISNKHEWNNCFIKFLKLQKFEVRNTSKKSQKVRAKSKKNLMKMQCCVTPCGQTDLGLWQRTFLAFLRTSKRRDWSRLSTKKLFFSLLALFREKFSSENIFSWATLSAIIYHIRSN